VTHPASASVGSAPSTPPGTLSVHITPQWQIRGPGGLALAPKVLDWLVAVQQHGSLSAACHHGGASYRHAWKLLREAEAALGSPLLSMSRGKGSVLTPLGERLVWAQRRVAARLGPQLDSLALELQAELRRVLAEADRPLRLWASHGFAIEQLQRQMADTGQPLDWRYCDSSQALAALQAGTCELASLHIPLGVLQAELLRQHAPLLGPDWRYIHLVTRRQGLMVRPGNPQKVYGVADLARPGLRFIPRSPGSGTRLLLEHLLRHEGIAPEQVARGEQGEHTHAAVAAYVASGMADVAFGVETSARRFGLEFIPVQTERYGLVCAPETLSTPGAQGLIATLHSPAYREAIASLPGYEADHCGEVGEARALFAGWPA
jgi:molybdate transport repressor ModE-like protein